jgi:hypothetical protein
MKNKDSVFAPTSTPQLSSIIMSEVFSFKPLLQRSTEVGIARCDIQAEWCMGKTFATICKKVVDGGILGCMGQSLSSVPRLQGNNEV